MLETQLQQTCIKFSRKYLSNEIIVEGTPAQAMRTQAGHQRMIAEGYIPGSSDLKIYNKFGKVVFVELKTDKGRQSTNQKEYQKLVESFGFKYFLVRSFDEFKKVLIEEFNCKIK